MSINYEPKPPDLNVDNFPTKWEITYYEETKKEENLDEDILAQILEEEKDEVASITKPLKLDKENFP